jgi:hypothetical protein
LGRIQVARERVRKCRKAVFRPENVFADIDTARPQVGQRFLKRHHLLLGFVSAIVQHDIE